MAKPPQKKTSNYQKAVAATQRIIDKANKKSCKK